MSIMKQLDYHIQSCSNDDAEYNSLTQEISECLNSERKWFNMSTKAQNILAQFECMEHHDLVNWEEYPDHEEIKPVTRSGVDMDNMMFNPSEKWTMQS